MTKKEILQKIENLFYYKDFKSVSMQDISNEIDMKKASLYYHFPSKEDLIIEVIQESFLEYLNFVETIIDRWDDTNFLTLLQEFLSFPEENKNIFSIINQNWYTQNDVISENIKQKQKIIFDTIYRAMSIKNWFSKEKTFLFLTLIHQIWKKETSYWLCEIDNLRVLNEIENLFFKN